MVNSMLSYSGLSERFWGEAMLTACYMLNNSKQKELTKPKWKTLDERGIDCIFNGYVEHSKAYRFYVLEYNDFVSVNNVIESRDTIFDEERFTSIPSPREMIHQSFSKSTTQAEDVFGGTSYVPELRKCTRART
uniref:Retroviral polymerase SH3-like domain-containing protein n=1 Tax=Lactuca sativa TaxID=4236 RepID=A0A9R1VT17_LACSA|nr:hypothetical protein LSAT_V11C400195090 [Lactuca sativa]